MPTAAVLLAPRVWRIPTMPLDVVNSFALTEDDGSVTLVDAGTPFASPRLLAGLRAMGRHPRDVRRLVLTHSHYDHAGSAERIRRGTGARVVVHADDAPYARRGRPPTPDGRYVVTRLFGIPVSQAFPGVEVADEVHDGDVLPVAGGLRVVHTPGHTPGHVSLLHEDTGVLITGDTILNVGGLRGLPAYVSHDFPLYQRTRHMLGEIEYRVAAFTHGPEMRDRARERIRAWLRRRPVLDPVTGGGETEGGEPEIPAG